MEERLRKEIEHLDSMREKILEQYLDSLACFTPEKGNIDSVTCAGILHDLDHHITNLHSEIKRIQINKDSELLFGGIPHA